MRTQAPSPPARGPMAAAGDRLRDALADRARALGVDPPVVALLGAGDVLGGADPLRRAARVHLSPAAVLIGPRRASGQAAPTGNRPAACGHCLGIRWQRLRPRTERDALEVAGGLSAVGEWPPLPSFVLDAVWRVYESVLLAPVAPRPSPDDPHTGRLPVVSRLDLGTLRVRTVPVLPDPLCPSCAPPQPDGPEAVSALAAGIRPGDAGPPRSWRKAAPDRYRLRPVDDYPVPEAALVNPVCGALGAGLVHDVSSPTTAPVSGSCFVRGYGGLLDVSWSGQANSYATSRRLALLEGLERYAGTHRRRSAGPVLAAYRDVAADALDPAGCGLHPPRAYESDPVLEPFSPDREIPWVWGWSLRDRRPILVPRRLCHYSSAPHNDTFVLSSSSGCASGASPAEAMLYGLLELIERDAFLLGWYGNASLPRIDLDSCASPAIRAMVDRAQAQGYRILAFDNRIDLCVPVVTSLAVRRDGGPGLLSFAAAAHVDPLVAVEGALAEALTYIPHLARTTRTRRDELLAMAADYDRVRRLPDHAALFGLPEMAGHAASYLDASTVDSLAARFAGWNAARPHTVDLREDLQATVAELTAAGFDAIAVDQTTAEQRAAGLHTVCMVVPGLVPIDFGWRRQRAPHLSRTRTAQRRGGLRGSDLTDADLRWVPHPFP